MAMPSTTQGSTDATANEELYKFPPFPSPPDGVAIVPFSAFVPQGYRRATGPSGEPIEVDGWVGMQTLKVLNEGEAGRKRKSKKKRRNAGTAVDSEGKLVPWWEEWEEGEALRVMSETSFASMSFGDRVHLAADDFRVGRLWPEIAQGVRLMWDQFRLYIGLLSSIPVYKKVKKQPGQADGPNNGGEASEEEGDVPRANHTRIDIVQDLLEQIALPGKQLEPRPDDSTVEAQRLRAFVGDIEKTIKVFLSSYMRDTGLIWAERNLFIAPTVLHFFLRFLLRNKVFADSKEHFDSLNRALGVAALAQKELPITAKLGQTLPDRFDVACKECWGTQGSLSICISATPSSTDADDTVTNATSLPGDINSVFETELEKNNVEVVPSSVVLDSITARQAMEDNLDTDHQVPVTTIPVTGDPWIAATRAEEYTTASWTDVSMPWLMQLLGPSVFPLTMTAGIVEFSTRRIRDVIAAGVNADRTGKVSAVEEVLGGMFFRVVLSPWARSVSEETADFPSPVIMPGSRGGVVAEEMADGVVDADAWDPFRDDVTVLVSEAVAEQMVAGMGLCGTWVQMVAEGKKRHARECYWYVESLVASFPSYYTERDAVEQVSDDEDEDF